MALRAGHLELAKTKFEEALGPNKVKPSATAHHNYAILILHNVSRMENIDGEEETNATGQAGEALTDALFHLHEACSIEPKLHQGFDLMGSVLSELGRIKEAQQAYAEAFRLDPENKQILSRLQALTSDSSSSKKKSKDDADLDTCVEKANEWDLIGAEKCFLLCTKARNVGFVEYGSFLVATGGLKRLAEAQSLFSHAAMLHPENPEPVILMCKVMRERGAAQDAEECLKNAAVRFNSPLAYHNIGVLRADMGRIAEAEESFAIEKQLLEYQSRN